MSSTPYATPLELHLRPSRWASALFHLLHLLACSIPILLDSGLAMGLLLMLVVLFSWLHNRRVEPALGASPELWRWDDDQLWRRHGAEGPGWRLQPSSFRSPWLCVLTLREESERRWPARITRLVLADSVGQEPFRRLRVRLGLGEQGVFAE